MNRIALALVLLAAGCSTPTPTATTQASASLSSAPSTSLAPASTAPADSAPSKPSSPDAPENKPSDPRPSTDSSKPPQEGDINFARVNQLKSLKHVTLHAGGNTIQAWIMDNVSKRAEGMMFLTEREVRENQGMIFVWPDVRSREEGFWMHNCPMGLDIIWISADKHVINVSDGVPESEENVHSERDYHYVLEMRRGWSDRHGLKPGDKLDIPPTVKTDQ